MTTKTPAPAPIDPGPDHRLLSTDEWLSKGDEYYYRPADKWRLVQGLTEEATFRPLANATYRRPLSAEADLVKASELRAGDVVWVTGAWRLLSDARVVCGVSTFSVVPWFFDGVKTVEAFAFNPAETVYRKRPEVKEAQGGVDFRSLAPASPRDSEIRALMRHRAQTCAVCGKTMAEGAGRTRWAPDETLVAAAHLACAPTRLERVRLGLEEDPYVGAVAGSERNDSRGRFTCDDSGAYYKRPTLATARDLTRPAPASVLGPDATGDDVCADAVRGK